jgi:hypothetical protein
MMGVISYRHSHSRLVSVQHFTNGLTGFFPSRIAPLRIPARIRKFYATTTLKYASRSVIAIIDVNSAGDEGIFCLEDFCVRVGPSLRFEQPTVVAGVE